MTTFLYENSAGRMVDWPKHAFSKLDLGVLELFLEDKQVIPLIDIAAGEGGPGTVAMRHDVDHSIDHALKLAKWERDRGIRSSYYFLNTAWYYGDWLNVVYGADKFRKMGHEVGFHNDTMSLAMKITDPRKVELAADFMRIELKKWRNAGFEMAGCADHGAGHAEWLDQFWQRYKPQDFGFHYEAYQLMAGENYISDNGGQWRAPLKVIEGKQTHMLVHPCHWPLV